MRSVRIVAFVGPHNCGKTGLVERLARLAARRDIRVGVIKRAAQPLKLDESGKDSARFAAAGAVGVVAIGPGNVFFIEKAAESPSLKTVARRFGDDLDLWLAETFAVEPVPWVGVARAGQEIPMPDRNCIATVAPRQVRAGVPNFSWRTPAPLLRHIID